MRLCLVVLLACCTLASFCGEINGRIYIKDQARLAVRAGYVGLTNTGEKVSCFAGITTGPSASSAWCDTFKPRRSKVSWDPQTGCTFAHTALPAGKYIVYTRWGDHYLDWKVVTVTGQKPVQVNLSVNQARMGNLSIQVKRPAGDYEVSLTPCDAKGKPIVPGIDLTFDMDVSADTHGNVATIKGVQAGYYQLELNATDRQGNEQQGYFTSYTKIGSWIIKVEAGKALSYQVPRK